MRPPPTSAKIPRQKAENRERDPHAKKLIEVGLPLEAISYYSRIEQPSTPGHPTTLMRWWARRPLAACRAVLFASLVDDPSEYTEHEAEEKEERARLHTIIRNIIPWKAIDESDRSALEAIREARYEIAKTVARARNNEDPPPKNDPQAVLDYLAEHGPRVYDPFAGGGSIPLEAQRLGLRAAASDLNPIPVLINKALIEIPPKFHGKNPINPEYYENMGGGGNTSVKLSGGKALASDIRHYGQRLRDRAFEKIGHHYPTAKLPDGREATAAAWLWTRTVPCSNPACGVHMPLLKTFQTTTKKGRVRWTRPFANQETKRVHFAVQDHPGGLPAVFPDKSTAGRKGAICIACGTHTDSDSVKEQAKAGRMGAVMRAIVVKNRPGTQYLTPTEEQIGAAHRAEPKWKPKQEMPDTTTLVSGRGYGITHWNELFTERQLLAMTTFCDLLPETREQIIKDGASKEYAAAVTTYLAMAIAKHSDAGSSFATWHKREETIGPVFGRQAIPMVWDYPEVNPFSSSTGNFMSRIELVAKATDRLPSNVMPGEAFQADATRIDQRDGPVIATDPPYYDNIDYAVLSDFFYVWLRPLLRNIYPDLFGGILTPKAEEAIAAPRFGTKDEQRKRFERLMRKIWARVRSLCSDAYPSSMFYAYKNTEDVADGVTSTGWSTFLTGVVKSGLMVTGTWPIRTETTIGLFAKGAFLSSSVLLVCRPRPEDAPACLSRREFTDALENELPDKLRKLEESSHIAPIDFPQAVIGPGMEIYSRYKTVEDITGEEITVREALKEINKVVDEYRRRSIGNVDANSLFCWTLLEQFGFGPLPYGDAEKLATAKDFVVADLYDSEMQQSGGKVRLYTFDEHRESLWYERLPKNERKDADKPTKPRKSFRAPMSAWEACFRMASDMEIGEENLGIAGAAESLRRTRRAGVSDDAVENLARALYSYFERRNPPVAVLFNSLVNEWKAIRVEADQTRQHHDPDDPGQTHLDV